MEGLAHLPPEAFRRATEVSILAERRLDRVFEENYDLRGLTTTTSIKRASGAFGGAIDFLDENPQILEQLGLVAVANPDSMALAIIPSMPLVVAQEGKTRTILAPALMCTLQAIDGLVGSTDIGGVDYHFTASDHGLDAYAWECAIRGESYMKYVPSKMKPEDYVALAVGTFYNEVFRSVIRGR